VASYLDGATVLELFAGSGAVGLEALSRGAASADFIESGSAALHALKANVAAFRLRPPSPGRRPTSRRKAARIFKRDVIPFTRRLSAHAYDLAFADPPYGSRKLDLVVARWLDVPFARLLGVEHAADHVLPEGGRRLEMGDTVITVYGL
jgi:16S rRNA (guanine966-N2)-methyltransferase